VAASVRVAPGQSTEANGDENKHIQPRNPGLRKGPGHSAHGQIVTTPTLVMEFPPPMRRLIGNLSNTTGMFVGLDLNTRGRTALQNHPVCYARYAVQESVDPKDRWRTAVVAAPKGAAGS
jgi:hypothetical protein